MSAAGWVERVVGGGWARERRFAVPRLLPRRLRSLHTLALVLALAGIGWVGWLWYRSSSFVKVERVTVVGLSGPNVPQIRAALTSAALQMTTLNMDISKLEAAVSQYADVRALTVTAQGAHGVMIRVAEQVPVALVQVGASTQVVDTNAQLLRSTSSPHGPLPIVPLRTPPTGGVITARGARSAIAALAAAPYALIAHIADATTTADHGLVVQLRNGPVLYFGPATELHQKWNSAVAVLRSHYAVGASYIDLTDPERPAAGVTVSPSQATALGLATAGTAGTTSGNAGNGTGATSTATTNATATGGTANSTATANSTSSTAGSGASTTTTTG